MDKGNGVHLAAPADHLGCADDLVDGLAAAGQDVVVDRFDLAKANRGGDGGGDETLELVPESSGNRLMVAIRLMHQGEDHRPQTITEDVSMELALCA